MFFIFLIMDETFGVFFKRVYTKKPNCSLCYNRFREEDCFEFLIYKCFCKPCEREEIICQFCSQYVKQFLHICNCGVNEQHLTRNLFEDIKFI